jgi:alpha-L-rhamnosidase
VVLSPSRSTTAVPFFLSAVLVGVLAGVLGVAPSAVADTTASAVKVATLRVASLTNPLGIDDLTPDLSWRLTASGGRNHAQTAYQIVVASSEATLKAAESTPGRADLWDSGRVASVQSIGVSYAGKALTSRQRVFWSVRIWDEIGRASGWAPAANWELGLLSPADWSAHWIANPDWLDTPHPLVINIPARTGRYLRLDASRLGLPLKEGWPDPVSRLQLAEIEAYGGGKLLSRGVPVQASESYNAPGQWGLTAIDDGTLTSKLPPYGYTSLEHHGQDLGTGHVWIELDLGRDVSVDKVLLYPRTDTVTADGRTANFPENFTLALRADGAAATSYTTIYSVTGQVAPAPPSAPPAMPLFSDTFTLAKPIARARLYATGLGLYEARLNGAKVGDAVLEPSDTDYRQQVKYTTYDVTGNLRQGGNTLGFLVGRGSYDVPSTPGRYTKYTGSFGPPKVIAQLEVTYTDGTTVTVNSDQQWRTTNGPITFSGWFGGEDFDAAREQPGWDGAPTSGSTAGSVTAGWASAVVTGAPTATTVLRAQEAAPVKVQQTLTAVSVKKLAAGTWIYDLGRNIAGFPQITVAGLQGSTIRITPAELLYADGTPNQSQSGGPMYYNYTPATQSQVTWHPRFTYTGFRWLQLTGLSAPLPLSAVKGLAVRADNVAAGSFTSSDPMLNQINTLVVRAVENNMASVLTDCPTREKLGWLEETHLLFDTVAANFDVAAYYRQLMENLAEAQLPSGQMPEIAPEVTVFGDPFRDDPNWGGALIMVPWKMYQDYGDVTTLRQYYPAMQRYLDYLGTKASGNILDYGLGDWAAFDTTTPRAVAATTAYYRYAVVMGQAAQVLGDSAARAKDSALASAIQTAFNAKYFNPSTQNYGSGSQASNALPLAAGMVPPASQAAVLARIQADIAARGGHLSTGEIGLRALLDSLGAADQADAILALAENPTAPSYASMVLNGATTLTEYWDGPAGNASQDHFMLGAINDWSYRHLAGITPDQAGFHSFMIRPETAGTLTHVRGSWPSPYGDIVSEWKRSGQQFQLDVDVPVNTTATVSVPRWGTGTQSLPSGVTAGAKLIRVDANRVIYQVGSGHWTFHTHSSTVTKSSP